MLKIIKTTLLFFTAFVSAFATITSQTARVGPYTTASLPATLAVTFPYQSSADLLVLNLGQNGTENDPAVVLTLNSDYTVTGGGYNSGGDMQAGNVIVVATGSHAVEAGDQIVIMRNVPVNQLTTFTTSGIITGPMLRNALDKTATISQQLTEASSRALRFEKGETLDGTLVRDARAGKLLGFDADGNIEYTEGSGGGGGTTYTAGTGLTLASNEFAVSPTQSFTNLTVTNTIVGSVDGNAATATALDTARAINGVDFDGTAAITVTAAAGTLTGASLNSTVTAAPGLLSASVGTLGTMAVQAASAVNITGGTINGATVTGLASPSASSDAANKAYVDSISAGIVPRSAVVAATTANITLSAPQTIDGQAVIAGNRVLVKNQTAPAENGIYDVAAGAWSRSSDSNTAAELLFGYYYFVASGTVNGATSWFIQTPPTTLGVDPVVFAQFAASATYSAGTGLTLTGSQFSLNSALSGLTITSSAFNGTLGATTPSSVAATTGTFSSTLGVTGTSTLTGHVGIKGTPTATSVLTIGGNATGGTTATGVYQDQVVQSGVTTSYVGFQSAPSTAAAAFTLGDLRHFEAAQSTIGAGSAVTNQYGFFARSSLTGATNNFGFRGAIAAGTGRYNLYMDGTAQNLLAGSLSITGRSGNTAQVSISGDRDGGGGSTTYGLLSQGTIKSTVTGTYYDIMSAGATEAAAYTTNYVAHFRTNFCSLGAGSAITTEVGYDVNSTNNATLGIGYRGQMASAANRYNLYMDGTAQNYLAGETLIGSATDMGTYALQVTGDTRTAGSQTVTTNSFLGNLVAKSGQLNEFATNGLAEVSLNYDGYNGGTTQFRNTVVYDGKNAAVANFTGSTKSLAVVGGINSTTVGSTAPAAGAFTSLSATAGANFAKSASNGRIKVPDEGANTYNVLSSRNAADSGYLPLTIRATTMEVDGGIIATVIGASSPAASTFTTTNWSSNANKRTTKGNLNLTVLNVKDYGALGDGSTNDQAAIASACAAMTDYSALYFPPGNYRVTSGIYSFASLDHITIFGDGATITNDSGATGANTFVFEKTCSDVEVRDLRFVGTATTRGNGIHLRVYCSNVRITGCYFTRCSDFAVHISNDTGDTTRSENIIIDGNTFDDTLGDGVHVSSAYNVVISNNVFYETGDDSIGIVRDSLTASGVPTRIAITGNVISRAGYGTAAVSGMGIRIAEADDVLIAGNVIDYTYQAPIVVERYLSTSVFNTRIHITGNKVLNGNQLAGQLGSIGVSFCNGVTISDNKIDDAANGNGIAFLDCNDLVIQGNQIRNIPSRGIGSDDGTTTNVAANCYRVFILNNSVLYTLANQAIYCVAPTGTTINNMVIAGNVASTVPAGDYIYYNRVTTGKVYNNLQLAANTVTAGGTVSGVTAGNNQ